MSLQRGRRRFEAVVFGGPQSDPMRTSIRAWLGEGRHHRDCVFTGTRSVLRHAIDRAAAACEAVTVVVPSPAERAPDLEPPPGTRLLGLPEDRGSAAAVLVGAAHVLVEAPDAIVALLPAEHFVYPEDRFLAHLRRARLLIERQGDRPVLLGALPEGPDPSCAWVAPGPELGGEPDSAPGPRRVLAFHERVGRGRAEALLRGGALWNTCTLVLRVDVLWKLGWWALPALMERLETLRQVLAAVRDRRAEPAMGEVALRHAFSGLPSADFRRDLLSPAAEAVLVLPMEGVVWSEWSGPEQVQHSLDALGRQSDFALLHTRPRRAEGRTEGLGPRQARV